MNFQKSCFLKKGINTVKRHGNPASIKKTSVVILERIPSKRKILGKGHSLSAILKFIEVRVSFNIYVTLLHATKIKFFCIISN